MRYVALLRGVNVGGYSKLSMRDLQNLLGSLGYTDTATHLQSGNAIFTSSRDDSAEMTREIEQRIEDDLGVTTRVLLRTPDDLDRLIAGNPFPHAVDSPKTLHVVFLSAPAEDRRLQQIDPQQFRPDEFRAGDRAIYLWLPEGSYRTKLSNAFWEKRLEVVATSRNWNTVTRLHELSSS